MPDKILWNDMTILDVYIGKNAFEVLSPALLVKKGKSEMTAREDKLFTWIDLLHLHRIKLVPCCWLLVLFSWYPIIESSHCNSIEGWVPIDLWVPDLPASCSDFCRLEGFQDSSANSDHRSHCLWYYLFEIPFKIAWLPPPLPSNNYTMTPVTLTYINPCDLDIY